MCASCDSTLSRGHYVTHEPKAVTRSTMKINLISSFSAVIVGIINERAINKWLNETPTLGAARSLDDPIAAATH